MLDKCSWTSEQLWEFYLIWSGFRKILKRNTSAHLSFQKFRSSFKLVPVFDLADELKVSWHLIFFFFYLSFCHCKNVVRKPSHTWLLSPLLSEKVGDRETLTSVGPRFGLWEHVGCSKGKLLEHFDQREC